MADNPLPPYVHTDWHQYDLAGIWRQVEPENDYFTRLQAGAWSRTFDLLDAHRARLETLFDGLAKVWPPIAGSASEAYLIQLRDLIGSVSYTSHDASGNALALNSIADELMSARTRVATIHRQTSPPYDRDRPNHDAATAMTECDKATYDYGTLLRAPEPYAPPWFTHSGSKMDGRVGADITPSGSPTTYEHGADTTIPASSVAGVVSPGRSPADPVLTGAPSPASVSPAPANGPSHAESIAMGSDPKGGTWLQPPASLIGPYQTRTWTRTEDLRRPALPPEVGESQEHQGAPAKRSAFEEEATGSRQGNHHAVVPAGAPGGSGSSRHRRRSSGAAYTEWEVARGVPPVLKPPPEPNDFDPGPSVWGIDR
jgi:hypothetical protein